MVRGPFPPTAYPAKKEKVMSRDMLFSAIIMAILTIVFLKVRLWLWDYFILLVVFLDMLPY